MREWTSSFRKHLPKIFLKIVILKKGDMSIIQPQQEMPEKKFLTYINVRGINLLLDDKIL